MSLIRIDREFLHHDPTSSPWVPLGRPVRWPGLGRHDRVGSDPDAIGDGLKEQNWQAVRNVFAQSESSGRAVRWTWKLLLPGCR